MSIVPPGLAARLTASEREAFPLLLTATDAELRRVYDMDAQRHDESIGDNAQLYGLSVYHHFWFAMEQRMDELRGVEIVRENNAYELQVGRFKIAVHKLGGTEDDALYDRFPEATPTQRAFGERNESQLRLFDPQPAELAAPPEQAYELRDLVIAHFGNPRVGLAKWYLGAYAYSSLGDPFWVWAERLDGTKSAFVQPAPRRPLVQPFDQREEPVVKVRARKSDPAVRKQGDVYPQR